MSCPCDTFEFPPPLYIPAGLSRLHRQIATFPEFRAALLHDIGLAPALAQWRGRQPDDFGVMLLEMWAYICDAISFYDEVFAHESYIGTARQRENLRKLVDLLGYRPRPAVASQVELAAFADGRMAVNLPAGTAFRSGAFSGHPPQVFELGADTGIHPLLNQWKINPAVPATFGNSVTEQDFLLCKTGSVSLKVDDLALISAGNKVTPLTVKSVAAYAGIDGASYTKIQFSDTFEIPAYTSTSSVRLQKPAQQAPLTPLSAGAGEEPSFGANPPYVYLDSIYRSIRTGQEVILEHDGNYYARTVSAMAEVPRTVVASNTISFTPSGGTATSVTVPAVKTSVTKLSLSADLALTSSAQDGLDVMVHFGLVNAGTIALEALTSIHPSDPLTVSTPVVQPVDANPPNQFQLEDANGRGAEIGAALNFSNGTLQLDQGANWSPELVTPVRLFGNIVTATRGSTVTGEVLGAGDSSQSNQTFSLKKSPLTYLSSPTADNDSGGATTLKVWVDGVLWSEVPTFYGVTANAEVYIVRQDDDAISHVTFGDGVTGQLLPTGAQVVADYRYGAEAASPPSGSINQLAKPVPGLKSVRNPVAAFGGADAEDADHLREYAPRSALLLGRAISLLDLEAAASAVAGVRAVRADWRWNLSRQRPVAQIYYIGDGNLDSLITQRLRGIAEIDTPIDVEPATPVPKTLNIQIEIDPRYQAANVLAQVRTALMNPDTGLLAPERIGIGLALFRSRIYEYVLSIPGATSVSGLLLDGIDFPHWALTAGAGNYFDFETGALLLNGT